MVILVLTSDLLGLLRIASDRCAWRREFVADSLTDDEPAGFVHKAGAPAFSVFFVAALCFLIATLARDRHAKDQGSLAAFDRSS